MSARDISLRSPCAVLLGLAERSREFYFSAGLIARLDIIPVDAPDEGCRLHFGPTLICTPPDRPADEAPTFAATLELPGRALNWLLDHPELVDFQHPEFVAACDGRLAVHGARVVAELWLQLLKRPTLDQVAALDQAYLHAPAHARACDFEDDAPDIELAVLQAIVRRSPRRLRCAVTFDVENGQALREVLPESGYTSGSIASREIVCAIRWPALPAYAYVGAQVWAGRRSEGPLTRLHCDTLTSLLAHLQGRKRVLLYSPRMRDKLYPVDSFNSFQPCRVDSRRPNLAAYPCFAEAQATYVELLPGDLLVIPTGWFHYVWADEPVASVSRFVLDASLPRSLLAKIDL